MSSYRIEIVPYDPSWPQAYERERSRLASIIGEHVLRFEHMGSTAVPGLSAKPIIDISAGIQHLETAPALFSKLETFGYKPIPQYAADRYDLWLQPGGGSPTHILHFMELDSDAWVRPLVFRNALRADSKLRAEYMELKGQLAAQFGDNIKDYGKGKTEFVKAVIESILAEPAK